MKKLLLIPLLALLQSCAPKYSETTYVSNFSPYVKNGFSIYPVGTDLKTKNYTPLADLSIVFRVGEAPKGMKDNNELKKGQFSVITPTGEYMTKRLVEEAKIYGANAIVNFKITPVYRKATLHSYTVSGVAAEIEHK